ncbi:glycosyltransferase family 4 protein [Rhizobium sullae]|uniref:Glycosyltransferase involved in cell wall biosynthesis n=1 Tax=Rhizobium sullae TaxID=50338 RepID=A0A4R3Q2F0_RHISU|nr:glycosyltransferase family 4 protein [Rhizobium sullae]TCU15270.1 glycosyltransferase involved in cell wall biosynthesis [Rhizobium sullae]
MRLALVEAGLGAGGTERVVSLIVKDRHARGDEVHVFAFISDEDDSYFSLPSGVIVHRLPDAQVGPFSRGSFKTVKRILRLRSELRKLRPDVVLSFLTKINIVSLLSTRGLGIPVVVSERNNPDAQPRHFLWNMVEPLVLRQAHRLIMQTEAISKTLPTSLRAKAVVIGNPCDRSRDLFARRALRVVAVGRLVDQKGFDTLIEAFAKVCAEVPEWCLTIYGEGPDRHQLQQRIRARHLQDRISLPGVTAKAGSWIDDAALFVLSSRYEGFPNVLMEAMAGGLAVISTRCDFGPAEIIEDGVSGLLVPVDDVDRLAAALKTLMLDDSLRGSFAEAGYQTVRRFATGTVMAKWDSCIRQVTATNRWSQGRSLKKGAQ